jgi:hypothetical protein
MSIVTGKQFLTAKEQQTLKSIQEETQKVIFELGEIEMVKLQLENRHQNVKQTLEDITLKEKNFSQTLFEKYGNSSLNPETFEITKVD